MIMRFRPSAQFVFTETVEQSKGKIPRSVRNDMDATRTA